MSDRWVAWFLLALVFVPGTLAWKASNGNPAVVFWVIVATFAAFSAWGLWYGRIDNRRRAVAHQRQEAALREAAAGHTFACCRA
jgi:hypothetical protein